MQSGPSVSTTELADKVAAESDADVLFYSGPLESAFDDHFISLCRRRRRRRNAALILVTTGGDADVAYRIARCMQRRYERVIVLVPGLCKSAGTLLATGAHVLVVFDHGELGPLDVQMSKKDELWEMQSGLTVNTALAALQSKAYLAFEQFFLRTEAASGARIKVTTASDIAVKLTTGLFAPLYAQIDPLHVGEAARAIQVAEEYGTRLIKHSQNSSEENLHHIITHYPAHGFVIDRDEAKELFNNVREPTAAEEALIEQLGLSARIPASEDAVVEYLSSEIAAITEGAVKHAGSSQEVTGAAPPVGTPAEPGGGGAEGTDRAETIIPGSGNGEPVATATAALARRR